MYKKWLSDARAFVSDNMRSLRSKNSLKIGLQTIFSWEKRDKPEQLEHNAQFKLHWKSQSKSLN